MLVCPWECRCVLENVGVPLPMQRTILSHTHFAQDLIQMLASNRHLEANQGNLGAKQIFIDWEMAVDLGYNDIKAVLILKYILSFTGTWILLPHLNLKSTVSKQATVHLLVCWARQLLILFSQPFFLSSQNEWGRRRRKKREGKERRQLAGAGFLLPPCGSELRSTSLAASSFTSWAISPALPVFL